MKSGDYRLRASCFVAVLFVLGWSGWASAQQPNAPNDPPLPAVRGSGTPSTIPIWTSNNTIGDSSMTQSGSTVSVAGAFRATDSITAPTFASVNLSLTGSLALSNTSSSSIGVIRFGGLPVLHIFGTDQTFVGQGAGNFTMTGVGNTATGASALPSNTTGFINTATGGHSLSSNTTGFGNTATGAAALFANTTGIFNTATGASALQSNTTGILNTATGPLALNFNTTGQRNTAIGFQALTSNVTGSRNVAIGEEAGFNVIGDDNIDIGFRVFGVPGESNTIRIGGPQSFKTFIAGISGVTTGGTGTPVLVDSNGQLGTFSSSRRFKDDIENMGDASNDLLRLRPVTFRYKQAQEDGSHPLQYGLVAEEVAEVNPGLVQLDKDGQPQTVLYHVLPAMLLNEFQKQHQQIETQEKMIQSLQERLQSLEALLSSKGK